MPRTLGLVVVLLLLTPLAHAAPPAPRRVDVVPLADAAALVAWVPGGARPDAYAVYGVDDEGGATLLVVVAGDTHWTIVRAGFTTFGVSAIVGGEPSPREDASGCAGVDLSSSPPNAYVSTACLPPTVPLPGPGRVIIDL